MVLWVHMALYGWGSMGAGVMELLGQVESEVIGSCGVEGHTGLYGVILSNGSCRVLGPHLWAAGAPILLKEEINKCTPVLPHIPHFYPNPDPPMAPCLPSPTISSHIAFSCAVFQSCRLCPHIALNVPLCPCTPMSPILPMSSHLCPTPPPVMCCSPAPHDCMCCEGRWGSGGAPGGLWGPWKDYRGLSRTVGGL